MFPIKKRTSESDNHTYDLCYKYIEFVLVPQATGIINI